MRANCVTASTTVPECCPLCHNEKIELFCVDKHRSYYRCVNCELVFVAAGDFFTSAQEKLVYDQHQNSPEDVAYRRFLSRLFEPMQQLIAPHSRGLDFGSGPGPTLSVMFTEAGHTRDIYDRFYARDHKVWEREYAFISASEVVEHLHRPAFELERLWNHLQHGGILGIMTKMVLDVQAFSRWHYKNDPTHVTFFSPPTFRWLAAHWGAAVQFVGADVVIFTKR